MPRQNKDHRDQHDVSSDEEELSRGHSKRENSASHASPAKTRRSESGVTEETLRRLLADTQAVILKAQQDTMDRAIEKLESKQEKRFTNIEAVTQKVVETTSKFEEKMNELSTRLGKLEEGSTTASSDGNARDGVRRRLTLVVGGFPKDSKRDVILKRVNEVLQDSNLSHLTDEKPFCTGPRRTVALLPFHIRAHEMLADAKDRMHQVLAGIVASRARISGSSKVMWAGVSKTPAERVRSGHCGLVRKLIGGIDAKFLEQCDHDYTQGSTWMGDTLIASATQAAPKIDSYKVFHVPGKPGHWVNVSGVALEMKVQFSDVERVLQKCMEE